uniref:Tetraspanin n=2 Tax=Glossina TaxID=44049 RepID=A0A1A9V2S3_GLOAU
MGCATITIKYLLYVFNTLWAIIGILLIILGGFGWDAMPRNYAIGVISLGGVILLIAFFGCMGAARESARSLWTHAITMLVMIVLVVVMICFNTRDVFKKYALQEVNDFWQKEITQPGSMDNMQIVYACCGRDSAEDYVNIGRSPPSSCCKDSNCINPLNVYITGCITKVEAAFADEVLTTQICEWCLLGVSLVILLLATALAIHYTNQKRRFGY